MKNLFEIDSNEIKRILSLHKESTKNQYLNVISEQAKPAVESFTLDKAINLENASDKRLSELKLFKGATFKIANKNLLYSRTKFKLVNSTIGTASTNLTDGVIWYRCDTFKFSVKGVESIKYFNEDEKISNFSNNLKNLCAKSKTFVKPATKDKTKKVVGPSKVKTGTVSTPGTETKSGTVSTPSQLVDTVKQIETNIGIPTPTGQMTDVAIDALIAKLSE